MNIGLSLSVTDRIYRMSYGLHDKRKPWDLNQFRVAEHPAIPVDYAHFPNSADGRVPELRAHWRDPFVSLAAAAAVTSRIKLATGICLIPERDPIVTAKVVASLDVAVPGPCDPRCGRRRAARGNRNHGNRCWEALEAASRKR
jgi:hypothetical protein